MDRDGYARVAPTWLACWGLGPLRVFRRFPPVSLSDRATTVVTVLSEIVMIPHALVSRQNGQSFAGADATNGASSLPSAPAGGPI